MSLKLQNRILEKTYVYALSNNLTTNILLTNPFYILLLFFKCSFKIYEVRNIRGLITVSVWRIP